MNIGSWGLIIIIPEVHIVTTSTNKGYSMWVLGIMLKRNNAYDLNIYSFYYLKNASLSATLYSLVVVVIMIIIIIGLSIYLLLSLCCAVSVIASIHSLQSPRSYSNALTTSGSSFLSNSCLNYHYFWLILKFLLYYPQLYQ